MQVFAIRADFPQRLESG